MKYTQLEVKQDIFAVLEACPEEVTGLLLKMEAGEVDGTCYTEECKCLLGTLAELKVGAEYFNNNEGLFYTGYVSVLDKIRVAVRKVDAGSPAELWFTHIQPGDTPETNEYSRFASEVIQEWLESKGMLK